VSELKPLYLISRQETEGVWSAEGACLGCWCHNDATLRPEYHGDLFEALGYNLKDNRNDIPYDIWLSAQTYLGEAFGLEDEDADFV
jgi:hypothetical protein